MCTMWFLESPMRVHSPGYVDFTQLVITVCDCSLSDTKFIDLSSGFPDIDRFR